jgi:hypothetical protein
MARPNSANTPNQNIFQDNQNYDIDIAQLYNDWIVPIDNIRSYSSINPQNTNILSSLAKSEVIDITEIAKLVKMEQTIQESRCHAFFRWIGFPVADKSHQIYNPGFDIIKDKTRALNNKKKINIAVNPIENFNELSVKRENYSKNNLDIFNKSNSIDAGTLALSNGGTRALRKFVTPLDPEKSDDPFDMNPENQSYQVNLDARVGKTKVSLKNYQDVNGNFPTKLSDKRQHLIKPFIVDARIDYSVAPQSRLIAVPFVFDSYQTKVNSVNNVTRPLLEKIIRDRFTNQDPTASAGTSANQVLKNISESLDITDNELIQKVSNQDIYNQSETSQFIQSINVIKSMMKKLAEAQNIVEKAQGQYYWLPIPSASGPEKGCTVKGIFLPKFINTTLVTEADKAILTAFYDNILNNLTSEGALATGSPTGLDFGLSTPTVTFGKDTTNALGDNTNQNLQALTSKRFKILTDASEALKTIEIIMGDFSGLGLCDIIAIISALNIMSKENLVGFLDEDAKVRMYTSLNLTEQTVNPGTYDAAMNELFSTVRDFYNLMDQIYKDFSQKGIS